MIDRTFGLDVITPEKVVYSKEVSAITARGSDGYMGILPQHAPLITTLEPGPLNITEPDENKVTFSLSKGFMEVRENKVVILTDTAEMT
ncbi:MAG: ATP synthase F1 subunit epsilon [Candidatus Scalinduaceae bacterium]